MTRTLTSTLLLVAAFAAVAPRAGAQIEQVCHNRTLPLTTPNWVSSITVPRFNPELGTLLSVGITATARFQGSLAVENTSPAPVIIDSSLSVNLVLQRPDASPLLSALINVNHTDPLAAFDGTLDFAGPSGITHSIGNVVVVEEVSLPTSLADLALFTGPTGIPGTIDLAVTSMGSSVFVGGGGSMTTLAAPVSGVDIDICYTYDRSHGIRVYRTNTARAPGRMIDNFLVVENRGTLPATNLEVLESVDPRHFQIVEVAPPGLVDTAHFAVLGVVLWRIPNLAPGESVVLTYRARLDPTTPLGTVLPGGPVWAGFDLGFWWLDCTLSIQAASPLCACASACCSAACDGPVENCLICRANCVLACGAPGAVCLRATRDALIECFDEAANVLARHQDDSEAIGPFDPNEKRVGNRPTIHANERLVYAVHYENLGTLEALDVFIRDVLDPNLDVDTVQFLSDPPGTVDPASGLLSWDFVGINLQPGETANVLFSVRPNPGLPPGSQVRNRGVIQFETTPPITTNEVVNTIDNLRPSARVNSLPPTTTTEQFTLSWAGQDLLDNGLTYSVYFAEDDGPFHPLVEETTDTSFLFTGQTDSSYAFFCVARDAAGNLELQNPTGEAFTTIVVEDFETFCAGDGSAAPCPCGNFSAPGSGAGCANSLGFGARLVAGGAASVSADSLHLFAAQMANGSSLYFQGTDRENGGLGVRLGDGLLCAGGTLTRILLKSNTGGASDYPGPADLPLSAFGVLPGSVRTYQVWYRNAAEFCTSKPYNTTNGISVTWGP